MERALRTTTLVTAKKYPARASDGNPTSMPRALSGRRPLVYNPVAFSRSFQAHRKASALSTRRPPRWRLLSRALASQPILAPFLRATNPARRRSLGTRRRCEVRADYDGLIALLAETRAALGAAATITMAYYPDGRQEQVGSIERWRFISDLISLGTINRSRCPRWDRATTFQRRILSLNKLRCDCQPLARSELLAELGAPAHADLLHAMAYDQGGAHHSPMALADRVSGY